MAPPTRIPRDPDRIRYERCLSGSVADRVSSPRCTLESERSSLVSVSLSDEQLNREKSKKRQTPTSAICDSGTPTQGFEVPSEVSAIPGPWAYKKLRAAAILEMHAAQRLPPPEVSPRAPHHLLGSPVVSPVVSPRFDSYREPASSGQPMTSPRAEWRDEGDSVFL